LPSLQQLTPTPSAELYTEDVLYFLVCYIVIYNHCWELWQLANAISDEGDGLTLFE